MKDTKNNNIKHNAGSNFWFLKEHDPIFFQLAVTAERAFASDPNTTLIKLRQLGEALIQDMAARCGIQFDDQTKQVDLIFKVNKEIDLDSTIRRLFHALRIEGNKANHQFRTKHKEAMDGLKLARELAVWFHQSFGKEGANFKPGPFILPPDPSQQLRDLQSQVLQMKSELIDANEQVETNKFLADLEAQEKAEYEALALQMDAEARCFEQQAKQHDVGLVNQQKQFDKHIQSLQAKLAEQTKQNQQAIQQIYQRTQQASKHFTLNEELTRLLIDEQLEEAGWEADSESSTQCH